MVQFVCYMIIKTDYSTSKKKGYYDIGSLKFNENATTVKPMKLVIGSHVGSQTEEIQNYKRALITGRGRTKCKYNRNLYEKSFSSHSVQHYLLCLLHII